MTPPPIRRVVTGHDADGKAIVASDGALPVVAEIAAIAGTVFHEVWSTSGAPSPVYNGADPTLGQPSAIDTARMFGKEHYLELFDNA